MHGNLILLFFVVLLTSTFQDTECTKAISKSWINPGNGHPYAHARAGQLSSIASQRIPVRSPPRGKPQYSPTKNVNVHGWNDNCVQCTVAGLAGITTNRLVKDTRIPMRHGVPGSELQGFTTQLSRNYFPKAQTQWFSGYDNLNDHLQRRVPPGRQARFGIQYQDPLNPFGAHMKVMDVKKDSIGNIRVSTNDFQMNPLLRNQERRGSIPMTTSNNGYLLLDTNPNRSTQFSSRVPRDRSQINLNEPVKSMTNQFAA